jgi:hypothetical protein
VLSRILTIVFAFLVSCLIASLMVLIVGVLIPGWAKGSLPGDLSVIGATVPIIPLIFAVTLLLSLIPSVPVIVVAEYYRWRSPFFYAACGILIGAIAQLLLILGLFLLWGHMPGYKFTFRPTYFTALCAIAGLSAGLIYWVLAGRRAGVLRTAPPPPLP